MSDIVRLKLQRTLHYAILIAYFLIPWWLRPDGLPHQPYFFGFLLTIPVAVAILAWVLLGLPGLQTAITDRRHWWIITAMLFLGWAVLSVRWAEHKTDAYNAAWQLVGVLLFTLVATCAGPSARSVTAALAAGLIFQAVITVAQTGLQHPVGLSGLGEFEIRPNRVGLSILSSGGEIWMRPYGMTIHPNVLGGYFTVALLAMLGWLHDRGLERWRYVVRVSIAALGFWALCLTFSRSAWGALVIGLIVVIFGWRRAGTVHIPRQWLLRVTVGAAVLVVIFGLTYTKLVAARTGTGDDTNERRSISDREVLMDVTFQAVSRHPIRGVGIGNFPWIANDIINEGPYRGWMGGENVHNIHLLALGELGIIGFALWGLVWATGLITALRIVRDPFAVALVGGVVALLAIGMLDHYPYSIFHFALLLWATLGIALKPQDTLSKQPAICDAPEKSAILGE